MTAISVTKARENIYQILSERYSGNIIFKFDTRYGRKHYSGWERTVGRMFCI